MEKTVYTDNLDFREHKALRASRDLLGLMASTAMSSLKTAPRGFARDHPRIDLLRMKGLVVTRRWKPAKWMETKAVVERVRDTWAAAAPMNIWLDMHVGPSRLAPDDDALARFGPR